uniref:Biogenesis of lysosome-related organelles complex 1 subunit 1 n=1 Tax=Nelumbo nucifera TaxID=4432 RepID=A0A822YPE1_NELNU|nr:TPA_asm: hypothetical protein HUJ06_012292 [Nelumbo nucifera]
MYSRQPPTRVRSSPNIERHSKEVGGLESSLLQLVQDHQQTSLRVREETEKAKKAAIKTAIRVSDALLDTVNGGVQESFINEKRIELEIRSLSATIMRYAKQTDQWLAASHALNSAVKEEAFHVDLAKTTNII